MSPDKSISPHLRTGRIPLAIAIFLLAFGVRTLAWHDTRLEVGKVQTAVTADYQRVAQLLREGGVTAFLSGSSPLADLNNLGHPPGYSILLAVIYSTLGQSNAATQFVQIIFDALGAVLILLIVAELMPLGAGVVAGLLAALSPQLTWNSVLLLPDSLAVFPILLAIYLITLASRRPRLFVFIIIGALVGVSCWLRANAMLLTFFVAAALPLLITGGKQWRYAFAVICGTLLIVLPLTFRNAIVHHRFIPISLGAGQTLLEGIADYDRDGSLGIPRTDVGIMKQEAQLFGRPDYDGTLFNPDGVERERARLARGFAVIRSRPFWFAGVMTRRASSMVRLERSRLIATWPPVTGSLDVAAKQPTLTITAQDLLTSGIALSPRAQVSLDPGNEMVNLIGDESKYGEQFAVETTNVRENVDYVVTFPIKVERGRMKISVIDSGQHTYSSTVVETIENTAAERQPVNLVQMPFVTRSNQKLQLRFTNEASDPPGPSVKIGQIKIYDLGPSRFLWTRYPRFVIHALQRIFLTAVILPIAIIGLGLLVVRKQSAALVILMMVPVYYFCIQSAVHTEYRYVLAVNYFLFALVGVTASAVIKVIARALK